MITQRRDAARRLLSLLGVSRRQVTVLVLLGVVYAGFEGIGVGMLLPVLRYVEHASVATPPGAAPPLYPFVRRAVEAAGLPPLLALVLLAFVPVLARQLFRYFHQVYAEQVRFAAIARLRAEGFAAMMEAPLSFFAAQGQGRLANVLTTEIERCSAALPFFLQLCEALILSAVYLALLLALAPWLVPVALLAMGAVLLVVRARLEHSRRYGARVSASYEALHVHIAEKIAGIRLVKMGGQEAREASALEAIVGRLTRALVKLCREKEGIEVSVEPVMILGAFVALYVAVTSFGMTLASLGVFMFILLRAVPLLKQVSVARQTIGSLMAGLENAHAVVARARSAGGVRGGTVPFPGVRRELAFDRVCFSYGDDGWALRDITFRAEKGSVTAVVGRSGAGKSTLLDLIPRLREPSGGRITIDGVPIATFEPRSLRSAIGVMDQHGFLFNDTLANNIVYGLAGIGREAIVHAAQRAYVDHFVTELPRGYDTVVGERGVRLSAGQRQRVSLARVLLQDPDILLLDEPTSALDSESEQHIQAVLDRLRETKVIIVVAHRLSTVRRADQILVLDQGRIIERGDHESLLKDWGTYKRLFDLQIQT